MGWKERLDKLPTTIQGFFIPITGEECIEENIGKAHLIATRSWLPFKGICYVISLSGQNDTREGLISEIIAAIGPPSNLDKTREPWQVIWETGLFEIPDTKAHKTLGRPQIEKICQTHSLTGEEQNILHALLAVLDMFEGIPKTRERVTLLLLEELKKERIDAVLEALLQIECEAFIERTRP